MANRWSATKNASTLEKIQSWCASTYGSELQLYPKLHVMLERLQRSLRGRFPLTRPPLGSSFGLHYVYTTICAIIGLAQSIQRSIGSAQHG
ncbi:uncharacterized protein BDV17DRAFT_276579 [Aspergillus undulatus]|uniref:uncharacterized protein n=1 Tax=Aspergillus undulatus TaxID=1810928 RepID=UPI003CCCB62C